MTGKIGMPAGCWMLMLGVVTTTPALAQSDSEQVIVLRCVENQDVYRDIVLDLGQKSFSDAVTMQNLPGGGTYRSPAGKGDIDSITSDEVRFGSFVMNRLTGTLRDANGNTYQCERRQKVF